MEPHDSTERPAEEGLSKLDPHTAHVSHAFEDCDGSIGRVYYWHEPFAFESVVEDAEFRRQHAQTSDEEWSKLFAAAFHRGERARILRLVSEDPERWQTESARNILKLGYRFCPAGSRVLAQRDEELMAAFGMVRQPLSGGPS